jgi:hypothetical protein
MSVGTTFYAPYLGIIDGHRLLTWFTSSKKILESFFTLIPK